MLGEVIGGPLSGLASQETASEPPASEPPASEPPVDGGKVRIAVLDTGVDAAHPDLAQAVVGTYNTTSQSIDDINGHGTHCAGIIAGTGEASAGVYRGVAASGCEIISIKCVQDDGTAFESDIVEAIQLAMSLGCHIISMSFGATPSVYDAVNPSTDLAIYVRYARQGGIIAVASAGNSGPAANTILAPAIFGDAIAVAAHDSSGRTASFSSRGPNHLNPSVPKPNVAAPGVNIVSTRSSHCSRPPLESYPQYTTLSGTSMACPYLAGVVGLKYDLYRYGGLGTLTLDAAMQELERACYLSPLETADAQGFGCVLDSFLYGAGGGFDLLAVDSLIFSDALDAPVALVVLEALVFNDSSFAQQIFQYAVASGVGLRSGIAFGHSLLALDAVLAEDTGALEVVVHVLEAVYASDLPTVQRFLHTRVDNALTLRDALTHLVMLLAEENVSLDAEALEERIALLRAIEQLELQDSALASYILSVRVVENTTLSDSLQNLLLLLNQDNLSLSAPVRETINRMLLARDVLSILSPSATQAELTLLVATSVALHTSLEAALLLLADDVLAVADEVAALRDAFVRAMESLTLEATPAASLSFAVLGNDSLAMQDEGLNFANFTTAVEDVINFAGVLTLPDGSQYTAWATTLSTRAPYEYSNYPFNSFATMGDKHYGLKDNGLYLLEGGNDDGEAIEARIKTGLLDFGTQHLKNVVRAYLGYHADGRLTLHVTDTDGGDKREVVYELDQTHDAYKEARIKLGKGVRARYWQFELRNVDGADFRLDALDVLPVALKRRV